MESAIVEVMQIESKSLVLALAQDMMLYQITLFPSGKAEEKIRVSDSFYYLFAWISCGKCMYFILANINILFVSNESFKSFIVVETYR